MSDVYPEETVAGYITTWVPLTTAWASVQGCSDSYMQEWDPDDGNRLVAFDPSYGTSVDSQVQCLPAAVSSWYNQGNGEINGANHVVTSVGPVTCPVDWSTLATSVKYSTSTQVLCCPPGYSLSLLGTSTELYGNCISAVAAGSVISYAATLSTDAYAYSTTSTTLQSASTVIAPPIKGWNIGLATASASSSSSSSTSGTGNGGSGQSNGLSVGAKAGIGAGVGVAVLAIIGLVAWVVVLKRKNKRRPAEGKEMSANMQQYPSDPHGRHDPDNPSELVAKSLERPHGETKAIGANVQQYPSEQYGRFEPQYPNSNELAAPSAQRYPTEPYYPSELTGVSMQQPRAELHSNSRAELPSR